MGTKWFILAAVVIAAIPRASSGAVTSLPCPDPGDIAPCVCTFDVNYEMTLDCSAVADEDELEKVFNAVIPFNSFRLFKMNSNDNVLQLRDGVFGAVIFQSIEITHGSLVEVQEETLAGSYATIGSINLEYNQLSSFPFSRLLDFTVLTQLQLNNNEFHQLPSLKSDTLTYLNMGYNPLGKLPVTAFQGLPNLEECRFDDTGLTVVSPGTFIGLDKLTMVDLAGNAIEHLSTGTISLAGPGYVNLGANGLATMDVEAITGLGGGEIYLFMNSLTVLDEDVFRPILEEVTYFEFFDNPLTCGCDIAWLITNPIYMDRLDYRTTCFDGELLTDLDPAIYENLCPSPASHHHDLSTSPGKKSE